MALRALVDGGLADLAGFADAAVDGDVRCHFARPQRADEGGYIISFIGTQRDASLQRMPVDHGQRRLAFGGASGVAKKRLHRQSVAVLHQHMAHEA